MFSYVIVFLVFSQTCLNFSEASSLRPRLETGQSLNNNEPSQSRADANGGTGTQKNLKDDEKETGYTVETEIELNRSLADLQGAPGTRLRRTAIANGLPVSSYGYLVRAKLLWHVGIYSKSFEPYMQICGGTLVTTKAVISAAHCFWSDVEGALPASQFAVGAGNVFRPWDHYENTFNQNSDISEIHIPLRYHGIATSFQEDIAVLLLTEELEITPVVQPACVSFDEELDKAQISNGSLGTVLGWGLTSADGIPSKALNRLAMPAVDIQDCLEQADHAFVKYITVDKICAGVTTGGALCRGDSGGGWIVFDDGTPYLRGVASTAPRDGHECNTHALAALTHVASHRAFLLRHLPQLEEECGKDYERPHISERDSVESKSKCEL